MGLDPGSLGSCPGPKAGSTLGGRPPRDPLKLTLKINSYTAVFVLNTLNGDLITGTLKL